MSDLRGPASENLDRSPPTDPSLKVGEGSLGSLNGDIYKQLIGADVGNSRTAIPQRVRGGNPTTWELGGMPSANSCRANADSRTPLPPLTAAGHGSGIAYNPVAA